MARSILNKSGDSAPKERQMSALLEETAGHSATFNNKKNLTQRVTGSFFTPESVGKRLILDLLPLTLANQKRIRIVDPFGGDGRLILWLTETLLDIPRFHDAHIHADIWELDDRSVEKAVERSKTLLSNRRVTLNVRSGDSFHRALSLAGTFDICITNPPWEVLKPDHREMASMTPDEQHRYALLLRENAEWLNDNFPHSRPSRTFSGWGVNLARCGIEASLNLLRPGGLFGVVAPATIFGDQVSKPIRSWMFQHHNMVTVRHFPAEARLFEGTDQPAVCIAGIAHAPPGHHMRLVLSGSASNTKKTDKVRIVSKSTLSSSSYSLGFHDETAIDCLVEKLNIHPVLSDLETPQLLGLRLGRELDETRIADRLSPTGTLEFVKGKDIDQYLLVPTSRGFLSSDQRAPSSTQFERIAWRDIARQSSSRRMRATLIPPGFVTGNSLNIAWSEKLSRPQRLALLGLFNSAVFELQVRSTITTNHLSVGAMRTLRVPTNWGHKQVKSIARLVESVLKQRTTTAREVLEIAIAQWYELSAMDINNLIIGLERFDSAGAEALRAAVGVYDPPVALSANAICNHIAPALSELDVITCESVPAGGNWKDIPASVPLKRLETIRESFKRGEGSRSTYYGRLHPDRPAYTINTYFTRPGNGCHVHYDVARGQHRTLTFREAARIQSFPDNFVFEGSKTSVATQIGNAVPPLVAYQVAHHLGLRGEFLDLFSGAGGLALGFTWAGWRGLAANEFDSAFCRTHRRNFGMLVIEGDIRLAEVKSSLINHAGDKRQRTAPLFVLGGPPCQGFSTAGKRRSMADPRNWLFQDYCDVLEATCPDAFVFENVTGLQNMEGGKVFSMIQRELSAFAKRIFVWRLQSETLAVPQRRTRIFVIGDNTGLLPSVPPPLVTTMTEDKDLLTLLPRTPSVRDALDDLPRLYPGEDGTSYGYTCPPSTPYQKLMRGYISPQEYLRVYQMSEF